MATINSWHAAVDEMGPHVVRIHTPRGTGTGFLVARMGDLVAVATAAHVVDSCHYWEEPIRIEHTSTGESVMLRPPDRAVLLNTEADTAALVFEADALNLPTEPLELAPEGKWLKVGVEVGWLGFPAIRQADLCFFSGRVSLSPGETGDAYLVDGVAINGVSGGPAFHVPGPKLIGVVSAYIPNRATGEALPGLAMIQDVTQFHDVVKQFHSLADAKEEEESSELGEPPELDGDSSDSP